MINFSSAHTTCLDVSFLFADGVCNTYCVLHHIFANETKAVLDVEKAIDRGYDPELMDKLVISTENKQMIKASNRPLSIDLENQPAGKSIISM